MAYPVVKYNSSTGSDSSPSDCVNSSANSSQRVTGTGGSTTLTFDSAVDLTGVADDGSDYIWAATNTGERHLFQISAFGGTIAACTSVTVVSALDGDVSNSNWHINGTRQTFEFDSTNSDERDWEPGWSAELASGTYTHSNHFQPGAGGDFNAQLPGIEIRAESGAATRPVIAPSANVRRIQGTDNHIIKVVGIEFNGSAGGTASYIDGSGGIVLSMIDCVLDTSSQSSQPSTLADFQFNNRCFMATGCYFKGGSSSAIRTNNSQFLKMFGCHIDGGSGTYNSNGGINLDNNNNPNVVISDCLINGCSGDGINAGTGGNQGSLTIINNTLVDNGGCGLRLDDQSTSSDTTPQKDAVVMNNLSAFNGEVGFSTPSTVAGRWQFEQSSIWAGNATFSNTSGAYSGQITESHSGVTLSADPFTDRAGGDYSLNSTSGGGADCTDAAFPTALATP